jgi:hypothetical protein
MHKLLEKMLNQNPAERLRFSGVVNRLKGAASWYTNLSEDEKNRYGELSSEECRDYEKYVASIAACETRLTKEMKSSLRAVLKFVASQEKFLSELEHCPNLETALVEVVFRCSGSEDETLKTRLFDSLRKYGSFIPSEIVIPREFLTCGGDRLRIDMDIIYSEVGPVSVSMVEPDPTPANRRTLHFPGSEFLVDIFSGGWTIGPEIWRVSFGTVRLCTQTDSADRYACKTTMISSRSECEVWVTLLFCIRELFALIRCHHPAILPLKG